MLAYGVKTLLNKVNIPRINCNVSTNKIKLTKNFLIFEDLVKMQYKNKEKV